MNDFFGPTMIQIDSKCSLNLDKTFNFLSKLFYLLEDIFSLPNGLNFYYCPNFAFGSIKPNSWLVRILYANLLPIFEASQEFVRRINNFSGVLRRVSFVKTNIAGKNIPGRFHKTLNL